MKNNNTLQYYIENFPDQVQDQIDEIMDTFDFEKVNVVMDALDWVWLDEGVPDVYAIRKFARKRLKEVTFDVLKENDTQDWGCSCGGFEARCYVCDLPDEDEKSKDWKDDATNQIVVSLKFVVEEVETIS